MSYSNGMPLMIRIQVGKAPPPSAAKRLININRFVPPRPQDIPQTLFNHDPQRCRIVRHSNPLEMLIYTDGACSNNGRSDPRGGWAFVMSPQNPVRPKEGIVSGRLENKRRAEVQTSNRAELRAVCAALGYCHWPAEGWKRLVIATDSNYVVDGITQHIRKWAVNGWRNSRGQPVANRDLWKQLLNRIRELHESGSFIVRDFPRGRRVTSFDVEFWHISRKINRKADASAKAAAKCADQEEYLQLLYIPPGL